MGQMNKYYHFETKANFNTFKLSANSDNTMYTVGAETDIVVDGTPDISYDSICYIKDSSQIWTHGRLYYKDVEERLSALENKSEGYKTYSSYKELGFSAPPTIGDFFAAMNNNTSAVISYDDISNPPKVGLKGDIVIYKNDNKGRAFAYYSKGRDKYNRYDGNVEGNGDWYMLFLINAPFGNWQRCNSYSAVSSWNNGYSNSAIKQNIEGGAVATSYLPLIGFAASKLQGGTHGDYNVSIGTQPSGDNADTDTRLFINWDNGLTDATRGDFRKDITTTFKTRGLNKNKILISDADGVLTTSTHYSSELSDIPHLFNQGTSKIGYYKYGQMVLISINGATSNEIQSYEIPFTPIVGSPVFESTVNGIASGTTYAVEIWITRDSRTLRMASSPASTSQKYYGQIVYFAD